MKISSLSYPFCITSDGRVWEFHACPQCPAGWYLSKAAQKFVERPPMCEYATEAIPK